VVVLHTTTSAIKKIKTSVFLASIKKKKKDSFHPSIFGSLTGQFVWNFLPAIGTAGVFCWV